MIGVPSGDEVEILGKKYKPRVRKSDAAFVVVLGLIQTRGNGGLFLCAPTDGYELEQGQFEELPILTAEERERLLEAAWSLNEYFPEAKPTPETKTATAPRPSVSGLRPGDDYNERGDVRAVLKSHGWKLTQPGENEHWCRPGKTSGTSATLKNGVFYVFSTNAAPFEPEIGYAPFAVFSLLEHFGDHSAAATALRAEGYGSDEIEEATDVDLSNFQVGDITEERPTEKRLIDPGPFPEHLLDVPGFIGDVMQFNLTTAYSPQPILALGASLAPLATLTGRKIADSFDTRTNLNCLGVCETGGGKERVREVNKEILLAAHQQECRAHQTARQIPGPPL